MLCVAGRYRIQRISLPTTPRWGAPAIRVWETRILLLGLSAMPHLIAPLLIIAVGIGWLLQAKRFMPEVTWVWILLLGTIGLLLLILGRASHATLVVGPFLMMWALTSFLRQTGAITFEIEGPILVITLGLLLALVRIFRPARVTAAAENPATPG